MRSKLFVPGSRPELFAKAAAGPADALSFDLEDAVATARKAQAREAVASFLRAGDARQLIIVRTNGVASGLFEDDLHTVVGPGLDVINVPMVESADHIRDAAAALTRLEKTAKVPSPIGVLPNIETPKSVRLAAEIAAADTRVCGLQIGYADLFEPFGIDRRDEAALAHVRMTVRLAAAEAGIPTYDGAFAAVNDPDRFRTECETVRALGFAGKSCIHPSQVPIANAAFAPTVAEVEKARRIIAAANDAETNGIGAFLVDGQMIDAPFLARARAVVAWADDLAGRTNRTST
ncbi:MAG: CoA ester lyase [Rhizobiales bacterium]|nr:CoA ester lyase [Hyphomicrobiales bacterium]